MTSDTAAMRTLAAHAHTELATLPPSAHTPAIKGALLSLEMAAERIEELEAQAAERRVAA